MRSLRMMRPTLVTRSSADLAQTGLPSCLGIAAHAAEFDHVEQSTIETNALLPVKYGKAAFQHDQQRR